MSRPLTRRQVIQYGIGTVLAAPVVAAASPAEGATLDGATRARLDNASVAPRARVELSQPTVLSSQQGVLPVTLTAKRATVQMNAPKPVTTYTYDGVVPGYTWELNAGDLLKVKLVNDLPESSMGPVPDMDRPHHFTVTNLHTHGLHVSPSGIADNIFLEVNPGHHQDYEIQLPPDHPGGLFWYHPHHHGSVTQQVRAGMAGMIVVRGAIDRVPEVAAAAEKIMVLQSIELGADFELLDPIPFPSKEEAFFPRKKVLYTVNGVLDPTITMRPGEVQRWRMVNAAEGKFLSLTLLDADKKATDLNVLAWDGLTLPAPEATGVVMLSSGNRVEMLVKAGAPGTYQLVLTPGSSQKPTIPGMPDVQYPHAAASTTAMLTADNNMPGMNMPEQDMGMPTMASLADIPGELEVRPILTVVVEGDPTVMALPTALPAWDPPMPAIAKTRKFEFTVQREGLEFLSFGVDGHKYDPNRPPYLAKLGTAEEWTLVNAHDPKLMQHAHVFHIHVNPFKITAINGHPLATPLWRDTFVLTKTDGDSFTFQMHFADYTGKFVEHCHVLAHEDLGMMEAIQVVP